MRAQPCLRGYLLSVLCALLIFLSTQRPGMLLSTLLQVAAGACLLALLLIAHRREIRDLVAAVCAALAAVLNTLFPAAQRVRSRAGRISPHSAPAPAALFQRPPPMHS